MLLVRQRTRSDVQAYFFLSRAISAQCHMYCCMNIRARRGFTSSVVHVASNAPLKLLQLYLAASAVNTTQTIRALLLFLSWAGLFIQRVIRNSLIPRDYCRTSAELRDENHIAWGNSPCHPQGFPKERGGRGGRGVKDDGEERPRSLLQNRQEQGDMERRYKNACSRMRATSRKLLITLEGRT